MPDSVPGARRAWDLSPDWDFVRRKVRTGRLFGGRPADAQRVDLPHGWNRTDSFQPGVAYYRGAGTYWRSFRVPDGAAAEGEADLVLSAEGCYGTGEVWLDGERLSAFDAAYLGFEAQLPPDLDPQGDHELVVRLTNRCSRNTLPGHAMPDFLLYGGLAGRVRLTAVHRLHFRDGALILLNAPEGSEDFRVSLGWEVRNAFGEPRTFRTRWTVEDAAGHIVAESAPDADASALQGESVQGQASLLVPAPSRWSTETPTLYRLRGVLLEGDRAVDVVERRIGFRTARFAGAQGFLLNGRRTLLRGCNRHESLPGYGNAFPLSQHREDATLLKQMGCNFVRLSHYPQHPAFLDACDEAGILVLAEVASWKSVRGGGWLRNARQQLKRMIQRDRHHPSVILWGLGNEGRHRGAFRVLDQLAHDLDPERPTIYAENHLYRARRKRTLGLTDVWGVNYELDVMSQAGAFCRTGSVLVSECSNEPHTERGDLEAEARQVERILHDLARIVAEPSVAGYALWCFNDYATLRKERYRRFSGVVDAWRVPKMAAAAHMALVRQEPVLHLFSHWRHEEVHGPVRVHVITNANRLQWVCGAAHGDLAVASVHTVLEVPGGAPILEVTAWKGAASKQAVCRPQGPAVALRLRPERGLEAPARDDALALRVEAVDADGEVATLWNGMVQAAVEGPLELRAPTASNEVWVHGGIGRVFVAGGRGTGDPRVEVRHVALGSASMALQAADTPPPTEAMASQPAPGTSSR